MKKVRTCILAAALLLSIGVTGAFAAGPGWGRHAACNGTGTRYVDANRDGVCDNWGTGVCSFVDADGNGICDNCGTGTGKYAAGGGRNYVDANGDGICDYFHGSGCGTGHGMHRGCGR